MNSFASSAPARPHFATTAWSVVLRAGQDGPDAGRALADLCSAYWYPLYAWARRVGRASADAEDAVQSFFAGLLERNVVGHADPERGRFRNFLLAAFRQFLAREHRRESAQCRGGGRVIVSLDGESRYAMEPTDSVTPEALYERAWALAVLRSALARLRAEYASAGKAELFDVLEGFLTDRSEADYASVATRLGMKAGAVRVAVHRLKGRFAEALRDEVGQTCDRPEDAEDELRALLVALQTRAG